MKKLFQGIIIAVLTIIAVGNYQYLSSENLKKDSAAVVEKRQLNGADPKDKKPGQADKNAADQNVLDLENREFDIDEKEDKRLEREFEQETRKYESLRKKKDEFAFHVTFSIGGLGYGVIGDSLKARHGLYRINYVKGAFQLDFRGGLEGQFFLDRFNSLSLGVFFEQRKPELKINYVPLTGLVISQIPPEFLYYLPLEKYASRNVVGLKYLASPITYRYYFKEKFYFGFGVDVALLLQGKTKFSFFLLGSSFNLRNILAPVDLDGRVVFGFIMNRIFIELGVGAGILKLDTMQGARRSMYLTAMIGYRI